MTSGFLPSWLPTGQDSFEALVREIVAEWFVGGILSLIGQIGLAIERVGIEILSVLGTLGSILLSPFGIVGDTILDVLGIIDELLISLTTAAGPLSPIVVAIAFVVALLIGAATVRLGIRLYPYIPGT